MAGSPTIRFEFLSKSSSFSPCDSRVGAIAWTAVAGPSRRVQFE